MNDRTASKKQDNLQEQNLAGTKREASRGLTDTYQYFKSFLNQKSPISDCDLYKVMEKHHK